MLVTKPVSLADMQHVADGIDAADYIELVAATGQDKIVAIIADAVLHSEEAYSIYHENTCIGVFGLARAGQLGIPWLIATTELYSHSVSFLRQCRSFVETFNDKHSVLTNYVDVRHTRAQRWLEWCGFEPEKLEPAFGVSARPFIKYTKRRITNV